MKDNQQLRELFTFPPIQASANTSLAVPEMPPQQTVTGDREVDAVLWLQQVVKTGNQALIDKALDAAKRITTPMEQLGRRYADHIARTTGNTLGAAFASFGFGELENQATRAIDRAANRHEALSRFGTVDALFQNTPAEDMCVAALRRCKRGKHHGYDNAAAMARFNRRPTLTPATIDDCLHAIDYWERLYVLRAAAVELSGDPYEETSAHDRYCFAMMAKLPPRNRAEAMRAFEYATDDNHIQWSAAPAILRNLVTSGWKHQSQEVTS